MGWSRDLMWLSHRVHVAESWRSCGGVMLATLGPVPHPWLPEKKNRGVFVAESSCSPLVL